MNRFHICPLGDIEPHCLGPGVCQCGPRELEFMGLTFIVHNAFDGREILEYAFDYADAARN